MQIGIVSRTDRDEAVALSERIARLLESEGHTVGYDADLASSLGKSTLAQGPLDFIVIVGGDGTILRTIAQYGDVPLLTVNMGTYGFLCEVSPADIDSIPHLLTHHVVDTRTKLDILHDGTIMGSALNEVVVRSTSPAKMEHLDVRVGGAPSHEIYGDGVIVSTPTGSTAYSLSAGGPVIHTKAPVICITPICPLFGEAHPYVVPDSCTVDIVNLGKESYVILDGQPVRSILTGDAISVVRSAHPVRFVRRRVHERCP
ncbi:MAG: NAD(+)/NADH kinase [Candidatus Methanofastidiosa archaeon]|nr:NAD(+)/NADH kinase [Candidatus Methanofastidiosa archaeon]MDD4281590.1 NAD(+)/NADH kinase [Candidatus Methanofastidiosa archaeon]